MQYLTTIKHWFRREAKRYQSFFLPANKIDVRFNDAVIKEGHAYCRLWLVDMSLAWDVDWFKKRYPVVSTVVRFSYDNKSITIPSLIGPSGFKLSGQSPNNLDRVIMHDYPLTPLFPFNRGLVELEVGLFSMFASDPIEKFIEVMGDFTKLLPVPELSSILSIVNPLHKGIDSILGTSDGELCLGYGQTFTGGNSQGGLNLQGGYFAAILAESHELNPNQLCVKNRRLCLAENSAPLQGFNYMLFRIERQEHQEWEDLEEISELVYKAQDAANDRNFEMTKILLSIIKGKIMRSPDLTRTDKREMITKIKAELDTCGLQTTNNQASKHSLYEIMQREVPEVDSSLEIEFNQLENLLN